MNIGLDIMGGDFAPEQAILGVQMYLQQKQDTSVHLILIGDPEKAAPYISVIEQFKGKWTLVPSTQEIEMEEHPTRALKEKPESSIAIGFGMLMHKKIDAFISAGNTGALTAIAHFVLKCLPDVERAPIMSAVPNAQGHTHLLDLGANVRATPLQLEQFAVMGAIVARDVHDIPRPRVGLLNIGSEESKGHDLVQEAHARLRARAASGTGNIFEYRGFVEGQDIFGGEVDVVVTDGFTGNVALKTMEGVAGLISGRLRREFTASAGAKLAGLIARPVLRRVSSSLDPRQYNGAVMVGLRRIVVKSHGSADRVALARAIAIAAIAVRRQLVEHVTLALASGETH